MSYLKSDFITLSGPTSLKPKTSGFFYEGSVDLSNQASLKSPKPCLYNLKDFKENGRQQGPSKTPPLILFVNLLMKDGKKTNALRVLSMTLALFKARISKIKLEKHTASLKEPRIFYRYFFYPFKDPKTKEKEKKKHIFSNYSIKAHNCYVIFSSKSHIHIKPRISKTLPFPFSLFPWFLEYKKVFPFISNFCFLFDDFYTRKRFFCGKFLNLKQFRIIKKSQQENHKLFSLLLENGKTRKKAKPFYSEKKPVLLQNISLGRGEATGIVSRGWLGKIAFISDTFRFKLFLGPKSNSWTKVQRKNKSIVYSQKCLWYKTLVKKPSWDTLTSVQKNSFLFCLYKAISNVKPPLECRTKRIGGSNKQIPSQVSEHRQWGIAIRWIIEVAQNEFSKRKNKSLEHKEFFRPHLTHSIENFGNVQHNSPYPGGDKSYLGTASVKENKNFISSLLPRRPKAGPLKDRSPKTKFYYFCFFLAESLENAYYKRGPAMQKRNLWVETALANRAFLRYRWW